jgi:outer membrane protein assembly factor BamB
MLTCFTRAARKLVGFAALAAAGCASPFEQTVSYSTDGPSRSGLLLTGRGLLATNTFGAVALLDATGVPRWRVNACKELVARPTAVGNTAVVACGSGEWAGLSLEEGAVRWRTAVKGTFALPLTSDEQRAFGVDPDGAVWALDATTGAVAWKQPGVEAKGNRGLAAPALWNGLLMVPVGSDKLWGLDAATGAARFHLSFEQPAGVLGLLPLGDRLWVLWPSGWLESLQWAEPQPGRGPRRRLPGRATSGPALAHGLLWVGLDSNTLVGLDPVDATERTRFSLPGPALGRAVELGDAVAVPTANSDGRLVVFDVSRASTLFEARTDSALKTDAVGWNGQVWIAPLDGRVLAFRPRPAH